MKGLIGKFVRLFITSSLSIGMMAVLVLSPLTGFGGAATAQAAGSVTFDVTTYNANPGGGTDSYPAVYETIQEAKKYQKDHPDDHIIINFPKGIYDFYPDKVHPKILYVSNTLKEGENTSGQGNWDGGTDRGLKYKHKLIGVLIEDMHDVTVQGNGSFFNFHGNMTPIATINAQNVTFDNIITDFQCPWNVDLTVLSTDGNTAVVRIPDCYKYEVRASDRRVRLYSEKSPYSGKYYWEKWANDNAASQVQVLDINDNKWISQGDQLFSNVSAVEDLGNHMVKITYSNKNGNVRAGVAFQYRDTTRRTPVTFLWKSKNITLDTIEFRYCHGFGMVLQNTDTMTFRKITFGPPKDTGRTSGGFADFMQISGCRGKIEIDGCSFANPQDDPINTHGTYNRLNNINGDRTEIEVRYMHAETFGFPNFFPGNEIEISHPNMIPYTTGGTTTTEGTDATNGVYRARVISVIGPSGDGRQVKMEANSNLYDKSTRAWKKAPDGYVEGDYDITYIDSAPNDNSDKLRNMTLVLDTAVPSGINANDGTLVENITYIPSDLEIHHSLFKESGPRGILLKLRGKIDVHHNTFDGIKQYSIQSEGDSQWMESGRVLDMTIRNNTFLRGTWDTSKGPYYISIEGKTRGSFKNVKVEGNTFYMGGLGDANAPGQAVLKAEGIDNLYIKNNGVYWLEPNIALSHNSTETRTLNVGDNETIAIGSGSVILTATGKSGTQDLFRVNSQCRNVYIEGNTYDDGLRPKIQDGPASELHITDDEAAVNATNLTVGRNLYFVSSDPDVIDVDSQGNVTALSAGDATVTPYIVSGGKDEQTPGANPQPRRFYAAEPISYKVTAGSSSSTKSVTVANATPENISNTGGATSVSYTATTDPVGGSVNWNLYDAKTDNATSNIATLSNGTLSNVQSNGVVLVEAASATNPAINSKKLATTFVSSLGLGDGLSRFQPSSVESDVQLDSQNDTVTIKSCGGGVYQTGNAAKNIVTAYLNKLAPGIDFRNDNWRVEVTASGSLGNWEQAGLMLYEDLDHFVMSQRQNRQEGSNRVRISSVYEAGATATEDYQTTQITDDGGEIVHIIEKNNNIITTRYKKGDSGEIAHGSPLDISQGAYAELFKNSDNMKIGFMVSGNNANSSSRITFKNLKVQKGDESPKSIILTQMTSRPIAAASVSAELSENKDKLTASFSYAEGKEARDYPDAPVYRWAMSDSSDNSNYTIIAGERGATLTLNKKIYEGKYIRPAVVLLVNGVPSNIAWASESIKVDALAPVEYDIRSSDAYIKTASINLAGSDITSALVRANGQKDFDSKTFAYQYNSEDTTARSISYRFELSDPTATAKVQMRKEDVAFTNNNGVIEGSATVQSGANLLEITVDAPDGITNNIYRFNIDRKGDTNATVKYISVNGSQLKLTEGQYSYEKHISKTFTGMVEVSAQPNSGVATISISRGDKVVAGPTVGGKATAYIDKLTPGRHKVYVHIIAETGGQKETYEINLLSDAPASADLTRMAVNSPVDAYLRVNEPFSKETLNYTGYTMSPYAELDTAADAGANVEVTLNGTKVDEFTGSDKVDLKLKKGENTLKIKVTSKDGSESKTYTVKIEGRDWIYLADVKPNGPDSKSNTYNHNDFDKWHRTGDGDTVTLWAGGTLDASEQKVTYDNAIIDHPNNGGNYLLNFSGLSNFNRISATVGISGALADPKSNADDTNANVKFVGDNNELCQAVNVYRNTSKGSSGPKEIEAATNGANTITLHANAANNSGQWTAWANVKLYKTFDEENPTDHTLTVKYKEDNNAEEKLSTSYGKVTVDNVDYSTYLTKKIGTKLNLKAIPNPGYYFEGWEKNGSVVSTNAEYSHTLLSDSLLIAKFGKLNEKDVVDIVEPDGLKLESNVTIQQIVDKLPATVKLMLADSTEKDANVTWIAADDIVETWYTPGAYYPQDFNIFGVVTLPEDVTNSRDLQLITEININVEAAPKPVTPDNPIIIPEILPQSVNISINDKLTGIDARIENDNVTVGNISKADIEKTIEGKKETAIVLEIPNAPVLIDSFTITKDTAKTIANVISDDKNSVETLEIGFTNTTVTMDKATLDTIVKSAKGQEVSIVVKNKSTEEYNDTQKTELTKIINDKNRDMVSSIEAYIVSGGQRITSFSGGEVVVGKIDFKVPKGKKANCYNVYYLPTIGSPQRHETWYKDGALYFRTGHFSDYIIVYEEDVENGDNSITEFTARLNSKFTVKATSKGVSVTWGKVNGAGSYKVYTQYCGNPISEDNAVVVKGTKKSITKVNGKKASLTKNYKVYVVALDKNGNQIAKSITAHVVGKNNKTYTNPKAVKVTTKTKLSLSEGKSSTVKASTAKVDSKKKYLSKNHAASLRFASDNPGIATVDAKGKITANKKGSATIYVYAKNGLAKTVKVTVK